MNNLHEVMIDLVKDTYHAEKQLVSALPKMAKAATSEELRAAFESHLEETTEHVERLKQVFEALEMKPVGKMCPAMKGLIEEGREVVDEKKNGHPAAIDAALIAAAQKVEHYEIAAYGTLVSFAKTLGLSDIAAIFQQTLDEEGAADEKLGAIAESVNAEAAQGDQQEGDDEVGEASARQSKRSSKRLQRT